RWEKNNDPSITISSSPFQAVAILNHLPDIHIIVCDPVFHLHSPDLILILLQIRKLCIVVRDSGDDLRLNVLLLLWLSIVIIINIRSIIIMVRHLEKVVVGILDVFGCV
ncbi:hypothetical protein Tco_1325337, partial [Tanacetum coccineum]